MYNWKKIWKKVRNKEDDIQSDEIVYVAGGTIPIEA